MRIGIRARVMGLVVLVGCSPSNGARPSATRAVPVTTVTTGDGLLYTGDSVFESVVRRAESDYEVHDVALTRAAIEGALSAPAGRTLGPEWFVGARVRVHAVLRAADSSPPASSSDPKFSIEKLLDMQLVGDAEVLEGELGRSKGFYTVQHKLITPSDLQSLTPPAHEGQRVRVRGHSRDVPCSEQCLSGRTSLPLFDVGSAESLP